MSNDKPYFKTHKHQKHLNEKPWIDTRLNEEEMNFLRHAISEENKKKWSKALKGGTLTEEHKRKISESHKRYHAERKLKNIL